MALMSPFLTYAEQVPGKPAKEVVQALTKHLLQMSQECNASNIIESTQKRQKIDQTKSSSPSQLQLSDIKALKANKQLVIGADSIQKCLSAGQQTLVFIFNQPETEAITKHLVSLCKTRQTPHLILPKF
jgi:hypothetical protein